MNKITKAVIPAAGLGTRFLPTTKTIPKEMLPIVDRPVLLYIVEEAIEAGIEDIVLITGRHKTAIEDFFDRNHELEAFLEKNNRLDWLETIKTLEDKVNIISVRQIEPKGLGHAVLKAQSVIGQSDFAVLLGDEITIGAKNSKRALGQLLTIHESTGFSTLAVQEVSDQDVRRYGIVEGKWIEHKIQVLRVLEKPTLKETESRWGVTGRYIFRAQIFKHLQAAPSVGGEIHLAPALSGLARQEPVWASPLEVKRLDAGDRLGWLKANVELGLKHPEIGPSFKDYLRGKDWQ